MTQEALGDMLGVSAQMISQAEADKKPLGREALMALHERCGVSLDYLLFGASAPLPSGKNNDTLGGRWRGVVVPLLSAEAAVAGEAGQSESGITVFFAVSHRSYAISITDDVNAGVLDKGDVAVFDPDATARPGRIVLARAGESGRPVIGALRYEAGPAGHVTIIQPANSAWPAIRSDLESVEVISALVASQRSYT